LAARTCAWVLAINGWTGMSAGSTPSFRNRDLHLGMTWSASLMEGPTMLELIQNDRRLSSINRSDRLGALPR
jgi:hypothetical protein